MNTNWSDVLSIGQIDRVTPVAGGSINQAFEIDAGADTYFLLFQPGAEEAFYAAEIAGLELFEEHGIRAPQVVESGDFPKGAYLLLTYLDEVASGDQAELGRMVADLHRVQSESGRFGFDYPTEMDDVSFSNDWTETWFDQFVRGRLDSLYQQIDQAGYFNAQESELADQVYDIICQELKDHDSKPALLHGDLWSGNYMFVRGGKPALFDPAPFYGDREFDLGATLTFGGFSQAFYQDYEEAYPLEEGAWDRIEFYNLYLLLVHLVKFGSSYKGSVIRSMNKIKNSFQ